MSQTGFGSVNRRESEEHAWCVAGRGDNVDHAVRAVDGIAPGLPVDQVGRTQHLISHTAWTEPGKVDIGALWHSVKSEHGGRDREKVLAH